MQQTPDHDVVIVGSGFAGSLIGARLAAAGVKVAILEAGPWTDRAAAVQRFYGGSYPYESPWWAPQPAGTNPNQYYVQAGKAEFLANYERRVGGTSWHWEGQIPRLLPSDFEMKSRFGVGVDWPISYDDLEPWYLEAEYELGAAGDSDRDDGSPRSGPYPMPAVPLSSGDLLFKQAAASLGYDLITTPQARNTVQGYQNRAICCGNATCYYICPVHAKYDATYHLKLAVQNGAQIIDNATAHQVEVDADGNISGVTYRTPDKVDHLITARIYVVAGNAIETPKLLLMSKGEYAPNGVANSSDQVGRNLADHPSASTTAVIPKAYAGARGPVCVAQIASTREGEFRGERSAFKFMIYQGATGDPAAVARDLIAQGVSGKELTDQIRNTAPYQISFFSITEQLPDPENRIVPDETKVDALGIPRPRITYSIDEYTMRGFEDAIQLHQQLLDAMGAVDIVHSEAPGDAAHIMGTYRMGNDPRTSVTDHTGRTHDHANLYLAGAGLFPTTGTANPTLTLSALALRSAEAIGQELGVEIPRTIPVSAVATAQLASSAAN